MIELGVTLDSGLKGGQRWSCGNSFRDSVPLRDGAGEKGLLSKLGSVGRHVKGVGVVWRWLFFRGRMYEEPITLKPDSP